MTTQKGLNYRPTLGQVLHPGPIDHKQDTQEQNQNSDQIIIEIEQKVELCII
jgi:hypothetical protein